MKDPEHFAGRFSAEVDRILERQGRAEGEGPPPEYAGMLALAEQLAALDFSQDSPLQPRLRQRLLSRLEAERAVARQRTRWWRRLSPSRPGWVLGALAALTVLAALVLLTPAGRAVAQAVGRLVAKNLGTSTTVYQVPPGYQPEITAGARERFEANLAAGRSWEFSFEGHNFGACCSPLEPMRNEAVSLSQAIAEAGFELQVPGFLPEGFALKEVRLLGIAPYDVFLICEGPDGRLGLYQALVGVISVERASEDVAHVIAQVTGVLTDGTMEEMQVGTTRAVLVEGENLVWEENGVSFQLIGPGLDAATLVQIAESLTPAR